MPRDGSGNYTLPAGNPVISGTIIETTWANPTMADVAAALTGSLPRDGQAGMTGVMRLIDGTASSPGLQFNAEGGTGLYRAGASDARFAINGADVLRLTGTTAYVQTALNLNGNVLLATGKTADFSAGASVQVPTVATTDNSTNAASTALVQAKIAAFSTLGDLVDVFNITTSGTSTANTREFINTRSAGAVITRTLPASPIVGQIVAYKDDGPTPADKRGFDAFNLIINPGANSIEDTAAGELMYVTSRYAYFALKWDSVASTWRVL